MGRKPKERKYVKSTDGRKNNGRKRGEKVNKTDTKHTCLLYTSPSPRDRTRSRMPSSA